METNEKAHKLILKYFTWKPSQNISQKMVVTKKSNPSNISQKMVVTKTSNHILLNNPQNVSQKMVVTKTYNPPNMPQLEDVDSEKEDDKEIPGGKSFPFRFITQEDLLKGQFGSFKFDLNAKPIAKGGFATVWQDEEGKYVLKTNNQRKSKHNPHQTLQNSLKEMENLSRCQHRNIVKFLAGFGYCNKNVVDLWIVLEHGGCSLFHIIWHDRDNRGFPEYEARELTKQLRSALKYLRQINLVHRDINPLNILYKNKEVKLTDFGMARRATAVIKANEGTKKYLAPEMISFLASNPEINDTDNYSGL